MNTTNNALNIYGDKMIQAGLGHGADITSQRQDELDKLSILHVKELLAKSQRIQTLDLGSGRGVQTKRMLEAGADMGIAIDLTDFSKDFYASLSGQSLSGTFLPLDIASIDFSERINKYTDNKLFDVIIFQRTIHYFPYLKAQMILKSVRNLMASNGRLYLSASGMGSELSENYSDKDKPLTQRFAPLSSVMASKHGIESSVCLYSTNELVELCQQSGLRVLMAQESEFGNIKIVAESL